MLRTFIKYLHTRNTYPP